MKVCIAGSRDNPRLADMARLYVDAMELTHEVVSGGSGVVDDAAIAAGRRRGMPHTVFWPGWTALGKKAGPMRNANMAAYADYLAAFWDGESRGTADCIEQFRRLGKPVEIHKVVKP